MKWPRAAQLGESAWQPPKSNAISRRILPPTSTGGQIIVAGESRLFSHSPLSLQTSFAVALPKGLEISVLIIAMTLFANFILLPHYICYVEACYVEAALFAYADLGGHPRDGA